MGLIKFLVRQVKHLGRYNKILRVLAKYGFEDYVSHFDQKKGFFLIRWFVSKRRVKKANLHTKWERIRMVCEELGPTFVKFGQVLSSRRDLIPLELLEELTKLQDNVSPFSGKKARKILEAEFGALVKDDLLEFDEIPFASASMAQVHRGKLKSGEEVVFKIQRPNIRQTIEEDMQIMRDLAVILSERLPSIRHFDPEGLVEQFAKSIQYELDFIHESINLKRFSYNFKNNKDINAPKVYDEYTSTKVITLEYIQGKKPNKFGSFHKDPMDFNRITKIITDSFFTQVFEHGFFHADPHAGNIIITDENKIYFIDYGMMGTILKKDMEHLGNLLLAIEKQDVKIMLTAISYLTNVIVFENRKALEYELIEFINKFAYTKNFHLQVSMMLTDLTDVLRNHKLNIPSQFFLLTRAMFSLEGLVRDLSPDIVLMNELRPIVEKRIIEDRNPITTGEKIIESMYDLGNYLEEFPSDLRQTMKLVRQGKLKVNLQHEGIDPTVKTLNRLGKQLIIVILVSSIILGSSVFVLAGTEPQWKGIPIYSLLGYLFAFILGMYLLIRMYKQESEM